MKQKRENLCLFLGAGFSLFLHAGLVFLLFLQMQNAPEPGGSGLLMDAFLASGGDGFYQTGVPWGDFDFKPGRKGAPPAVEEKTAEPEKSVSEKPTPEINKKTEKKSEAVLAAPVRKKTSLPVKKQKKVAALKKKAAKAAGVKSVAMIHVADINKVTGYIRGGCSPVGMKKQFATVFDESCLAQPTILVSGGRIGTQIECTPADLVKVTRGKTAAITAENA